MKALTVVELLQKKQTLQETIHHLIEQFEEETGSAVHLEYDKGGTVRVLFGYARVSVPIPEGRE